MPLLWLANFYRQLAALLHVGVTVYQSLTTLAASPQPRRAKAFLNALGLSVQRGGKLSEAMAAYPGVFSAFQRAMIAAGEATGDLEGTARRLAERMEAEHALRCDIKREMFTSKATMAVVLLCWPGVLFRFQNDLLALLLIGLLPLLSFAGLLMLGGLLPQMTSGRSWRWSDYAIARTPVLGRTAGAVAQAGFAQSLACLYQAGIPLPEAVRLAADSCGNAWLAERARPAIRRLEHGENLSVALEATGVLDPTAISLLQTGETTGDLGMVLNKTAEYLQQSIGLRMHQLKVGVGVAATLNVGFCVAVITIGFYGA